MAQSKVPKFGAWDAGDNVGYTAYFDTARKGKPGGPIVNPNDIQMNRDVLPPPRQAKPEPKQPKPEPKQPKSEPKQPKFGAWEGGEEVPYTEFFENPRKGKPTPAQREPQMNRDTDPTRPPKAREGGDPRKANEALPRQSNASTRSNDSNQHNGGYGARHADPRAKPQGVKFVGGETSAKQSPIHHGRGGRGPGSTPSSFETSRGPSGRPQPKQPSPGRPNAGRGASVPVFGGWNNNPAQADGYTVVFDQLKKDRKEGNASDKSTPHQNTPGRDAKQPKQGGCFSWLFG